MRTTSRTPSTLTLMHTIYTHRGEKADDWDCGPSGGLASELSSRQVPEEHVTTKPANVGAAGDNFVTLRLSIHAGTITLSKYTRTGTNHATPHALYND